MRASGYLLAALMVLLGGFTLRICLREFRRTKGSGTAKHFLYVLGALFSFGIILWALVGTLLIFVGPLH